MEMDKRVFDNQTRIFKIIASCKDIDQLDLVSAWLMSIVSDDFADRMTHIQCLASILTMKLSLKNQEYDMQTSVNKLAMMREMAREEGKE